MGMPCIQLETHGNINCFTFTYAGNVKWNMLDLSGKVTFREMFGRWCQTQRNIFTRYQLQTIFSHMKWIMPDLSRITVYHISGNVRKMISGVVDNFLFQLVNTPSPLFSIRHFQMHFLEWKWISIKISLKFVLDGLINSIPALIPIMVWCQSGDKPLSESMMA